ncbi:MAG: DoxX family protein [Nanoarchaeota archaeon]
MNNKTLKIIYWISTIILVALLLFSGITSLIGSEQGKALMIRLGYPLYLNYILGVAKILGAVAILVPRFKAIKEWAYAGIAFDFIGASLSFVFIKGALGEILFPLIFVVLLFVSYFSWKKLK